MITDIRAVGGPITGAFVQITSDERGKELINREEAILRIQAVSHHGTTSRDCDMMEALLLATDDARRLETGQGYSSFVKEQILSEIRRGRDAARATMKLVAVPDHAPSGGTRTLYRTDGVQPGGAPAEAPAPAQETGEVPPSTHQPPAP